MAIYRVNSVLPCIECSPSSSLAVFASSARASRLGDEPNAGGGCILTFEKPTRVVSNV